MKKTLLAFMCLCSLASYGKQLLHSKYKLIAIENLKNNSLDSTLHEQGLTVNFITDSSIAVGLSANHCQLDYTRMQDKISFKNGGCTKRCCDNEISMKFLRILREIEKLSLTSRDLVLESPDWKLVLKQTE